MLLIGLSELALSHQCFTGLYFRCQSSKMLLHHLEVTKRQFLLHFHARPRPVRVLLRNHSAGNGRGEVESKFSGLALKVADSWFLHELR